MKRSLAALLCAVFLSTFFLPHVFAETAAPLQKPPAIKVFADQKTGRVGVFSVIETDVTFFEIGIYWQKSQPPYAPIADVRPDFLLVDKEGKPSQLQAQGLKSKEFEDVDGKEWQGSSTLAVFTPAFGKKLYAEARATFTRATVEYLKKSGVTEFLVEVLGQSSSAPNIPGRGNRKKIKIEDILK